ncbi:hypothetical protein [Haemophilus parahaemolyticus]|jgi:hypothetical protein|uniref:hypothetical protein n=1 Tax=Haemophilus parahaemolyticus TaxID=735 RepID=UPI0028E8D63B|nr:hypothetical protein [Haemophilus parahaemolyticus]
MSEFHFLKENKGGQVFVPSEETYGFSFVLSENNPDCTYSIKINKVPDDSILIRIDENRFDVQGVFSGNNSCDGICKKGDYILVSHTDKKVIFIELKYGNKSMTHIKHQLIGIECIWKYICALVSYYYQTDFWKTCSPFDDYELCYFSIKQIGKGNLKLPDRHKKRAKTSLDTIGIISRQNEISYRDISY